MHYVPTFKPCQNGLCTSFFGWRFPIQCQWMHTKCKHVIGATALRICVHEKELSIRQIYKHPP